ncbi:MAG: DUF86 domain-containing protein [Muribaculaceae bacterium]|nr:DUF86 domain-containing protein [Muribaculaceae bacterium]
MDRKINKLLFDISACIEEIESYFEALPRQFEEYKNNALLRSAIHMNLSIIGEATNRILKIDPGIAISNVRQIIGTRNYIIHGYDSLRPEMIWAIIINDLPKLKEEVSMLLLS